VSSASAPVFEYWHGYPARRRRQFYRNLVWAIAWSLIFIGPCALGVVVATYLVVHQVPHGTAFLSVFVLLLSILAFAHYRHFSDHWVARVVPYFDRNGANSVPWEMPAFSSGEALASNLEYLDQVAHEAGVEPLSTFGFLDDLSGESPKFFPAARLRDAAASLAAVVGESAAAPLGILDDLRKLEAALDQGVRTGRSACLLLRHGRDRWISLYEMDRRRGTF
jgi:hypothetical protein